MSKKRKRKSTPFDKPYWYTKDEATQIQRKRQRQKRHTSTGSMLSTSTNLAWLHHKAQTTWTQRLFVVLLKLCGFVFRSDIFGQRSQFCRKARMVSKSRYEKKTSSLKERKLTGSSWSRECEQNEQYHGISPLGTFDIP